MFFAECYNAVFGKRKNTKTKKVDSAEEQATYIAESIFVFPKEKNCICFTRCHNNRHYSELPIDRYALEVLYNNIECNDTKKMLKKEEYIDEVYKVFSLHVQYVQGLPIIKDDPVLVNLVEHSIRNAISLYWSMPSTPVINPAKVHKAAWGQLTSAIYQACVEAENAMRWRPTLESEDYDALQRKENHKHVIYINFLKGLHQDSFRLHHYDCLRMHDGKAVAFELWAHSSLLDFTLQHPTCLHERWKDTSISYEDQSGTCAYMAMTEQVFRSAHPAFIYEFVHKMRRLGKELDEREALMKNRLPVV